jgi:8-amino-7-oxononanoate synthase
VIEIEARMSELDELGLRGRTRLVSGPQGPRVVLDGKPTLVLCSTNYLGLAGHPRVREAAADAAMRWGVGAAATRLTSGTMTIHRRLEEQLAAFLRRQTALLFGSGYLASVGAVAALARPGDVVFSDEHNHGAIVDGCGLSGAEVFVYDHADLDHLRWGIAKANGRGALVVTESVFSLDGDVAPLREIVELAQRRRMRTVVDEGHGIGVFGPGGRGVLAELGLEDQVDAIVGTLGHALGSYGGFVACREETAEYLLNAARPLRFSTAPSPAGAAAAAAALTLLEHRRERVLRLRSNATQLRAALEHHGLYFDSVPAAILSVVVGDPRLANGICESALRRGVLIDAACPPVVPAIGSRVRLTVMATHRPEELRDAAEVLIGAIRAAGLRPETERPAAAVDLEDLDVDEPEFVEPAGSSPPLRIFDVEEADGLAA